MSSESKESMASLAGEERLCLFPAYVLTSVSYFRLTEMEDVPGTRVYDVCVQRSRTAKGLADAEAQTRWMYDCCYLCNPVVHHTRAA